MAFLCGGLARSWRMPTRQASGSPIILKARMIKVKDLKQGELPVNQIILGDCLEGLKKLPDESIDMILSDPPFRISQQIKIGRSSNTKYKANKDIDLYFGSWDDQWESDEEYIEWCKVWLRECVRVLKPYRHLLFFFDKKKVTSVWDFLESIGMKGRSPLFWLKVNPVPRGRKVDFMKSLEECLWFTKTAVKQKYFNWQLGQHLDYVKAPIPGHTSKEDGPIRLHPCQKPVKVAKVWISYLSNPGDIVLDPFTGSGSFCLAAAILGRKYIGFEINKEYAEAAEKRLANRQLQFIGI